jgi:hypothetical protein
MRVNVNRCSMSCAALMAVVGAAALLGLGPLDPPNGPITSTYKTLAEVEPRIAIQSLPGDASSVRVISAPGSYYLTADLVVPNGKRGIRVAGGVSTTIDLNGFTIREQAQSSLEGILVDGAASGITIRNGRIRGGTTAIAASATDDCTVERITVDSASAVGFFLGVGASVSDCTVRACGSHGINIGNAGIVVRCNVRDNGGVGIDVDDNCIVRDCIAVANASEGISANDGCTVAGCTASGNTGNGINTEGACIVSDSIGRENGGVGIDVDSIAAVRHCIAGKNTGSGITTDNGALLVACAASENNQSGLVAGNGVSVTGCLAHLNSQNGIEIGSYGYVRDNLSSFSLLGGGLVATGDRGRLDLNHIVNSGDNDIVLPGKENIVVRNSLHKGINFGGDDYSTGFWVEEPPWSDLRP